MKTSFQLLENVLCEKYEDNFGNSEEEINQKEKSLEIIFPNMLRNYYKKYGNCKYITQNCNNQYEPIILNDVFIPDEEFFTNDKDYLVFYQCEESVIYCGIKFSDLQLEDPPVYICVWNDKSWYLENNSLANFLICKALTQIAVEGRFPYWAHFYESKWNLSDYEKLWQINNEIKETAECQAWRIFIKDDVLIVFESALDENDDYILGVDIASFNKESIKKMILRKIQDDELTEYNTNI